jgi:(E)-4-hydroxy-3-methylbut-2-enyl-diphosphate synthase
VGAGPGKVTLYKGKDPVLRNIPEKEALAALIGLMKKGGDWVEPPAR